VTRAYDALIEEAGPELHILADAPLEDVERASTPLVAEAISRLRRGRVVREAGYDGEYGRIRLFGAGEL
jgi:PHP family Zn ribbon phosphoesterase